MREENRVTPAAAEHSLTPHTYHQDILQRLINDTADPRTRNRTFDWHVAYFSQTLITHIKNFYSIPPGSEVDDLHTAFHHYLKKYIDYIHDLIFNLFVKNDAQTLSTQQYAYLFTAIDQLINLNIRADVLLTLLTQLTLNWLLLTLKNIENKDVKYHVQSFYYFSRLIRKIESYHSSLLSPETMDRLLNDKIQELLHKLNEHSDTQAIANTICALGYLTQQGNIPIADTYVLKGLIQKYSHNSYESIELVQIIQTHYRFFHFSNTRLLEKDHLEILEKIIVEKEKPRPNNFQRIALDILERKHKNASLETLVCGYFVDICLPDEKIIIEFDGHQHYDENGTLRAEDQLRDNLLEKAGYTIYRIRNHEIESQGFLPKKIDEILALHILFNSLRKEESNERTSKPIIIMREHIPWIQSASHSERSSTENNHQLPVADEVAHSNSRKSMKKVRDTVTSLRNNGTITENNSSIAQNNHQSSSTNYGVHILYYCLLTTQFLGTLIFRCLYNVVANTIFGNQNFFRPSNSQPKTLQQQTKTAPRK